MRKLLVVFLMASAIWCGQTATVAAPVPNPPPLPLDFSVEDIASQLTQLDINNFIDHDGGRYVLDRQKLIKSFKERQTGSLFNLPTVNNAEKPNPNIDEWRSMMEELYQISSTYGNKIPVLYGLDSVHGANYIYNATLFPQQIGVAATFNTTVARESGRITAQETRYAGVPWLFSPILDLAVQPTWARVFETFGEDTVVVSEMGAAIVNGIQSAPATGMNESTWKHQSAACIKHFLGYPNSRTGHDRTPSDIPMNQILQYYAPPFTRAINEGALSVMENYVEVNGRPTVASDLLLNFLLRDMFNFKGMLVTDYNEIYNLADFHFTSQNHTEAIFDAFNITSIDMGMVGSDIPYPRMADVIVKHAAADRLKLHRLRESGARVMELKRKLGVLDGSPVPYKNTTCMFACESHREASLDATRQSLTLLRNEPTAKNNNVPLLPLDVRTRRIAIVGQACDSIPLMSGGWTVGWQGANDNKGFAYGTTVKEAIKKRFYSSIVTYSPGCNVTENSVCGEEHVAQSVADAAAADVVIACVGEGIYAEKPGDIEDITLPGGQIPWMKKIHAANPNVIMLLVEGRPRILKELADLIPAIVHTYLPGPAGGQAITDVLTGAFNPSGRLPITYPRTVNNAPLQYNRRMSANTGKDYNPQWPFGHGLSYTRFEVSALTCAWFVPVGWQCSVDVKNTGIIAGGFSAIFYARQHWRPIAPEAQRVVGFGKVFLKTGETKTISFIMPLGRVSYHDEYNCEQGYASPITISVYNSNGSTTPAVQTVIDGYTFRQTSCTNWVALWQSKTGFNYIVPTAPPSPGSKSGELTEAYFISSVVCFGAGIVGTVILITWLRKRGNQKAGSLLEPSGI